VFLLVLHKADDGLNNKQGGIMKKEFVITVMIAVLVLSVLAEVPRKMNYQGILKDENGEVVPDDIYEFNFAIYGEESGGYAYWVETQSVNTINGIFYVLLGSINEIVYFPESDAWLGIQIGDNPEMTPRKRITSVGYSFLSDNSLNALQADQAQHAYESDQASLALNSEALQGYNAEDFLLASEYYEPINVYGHVNSVTCAPQQWVGLLEVTITIPETMMIYSFGTVSGAGWVDGWRMLQLSIYNHNYTQFFPYANPFGDVATAYHVLPGGTYHIQLSGYNMNNHSMNMTNVSVYAFAQRLSGNNVSREGPFLLPDSAVFPEMPVIQSISEP
jgi:hypothetical protein